MWILWRAVTGVRCISGPYGATVKIGGKEEMGALLEELQKVPEESGGSHE